MVKGCEFKSDLKTGTLTNRFQPDLRMGTSLTGREEDFGAVTTRRPPDVSRQTTSKKEYYSDVDDKDNDNNGIDNNDNNDLLK